MSKKPPLFLFSLLALLPSVGNATLIPEYTLTQVVGRYDTGIFNVVCQYSHTLADDPIVMPGLPGHAMVHDFFGNTQADAMSTVQSLQQSPQTTCSSPYDSSSYWAPQLKRADGSIVTPSYIKVYYRNDHPEKQAAVPIPLGLQLLAGNHHRPVGQYDSNVWFYCRTSLSGGKHSNSPPESCPQIENFNEGAEFSIILKFPNCWDGENLTTSPKKRNATYSDETTGLCPADFPIKIPRLQMHIHYMLNDNGNLKDAMLSMNPKLEADGSLTPVWGNLYSAHADFFSAWNPRTIRYAIEECVNRKVACDKNISGDFERSSADDWLDVSARQLHSDSPVIKVTAERRLGLLKFALPERLDELQINKAELRLYGRQVTGETGQVRVYAMDPNTWEENGTVPNMQRCPADSRLSHVQMWTDSITKTLNVTPAVLKALREGKREVAFCLSGSDSADAEFESKEGRQGPLLLFSFEPQSPQ